MVKKAKTELAVKSADRPAVNPTINVDARIAVGMFFTLAGTILSAFGLSTRDRMDVYTKSLGIDANLWWGLALLVFGIVMLAFGRRGQMKMDKSGK
jgi:multisubunit Na+/H+ antiporter MnhG subunit